MDRDAIINAVRTHACFMSEAAYVAQGGYEVADRPRLFKKLEHEKVRLFFPTRVDLIEEGVVVALVCLFDLADRRTLYAHAVAAGPTVNASLRNLFVPATQANPQPGIEGRKAIVKFVAWKQAAWSKFLNDELELGLAEASAAWLANFWRALDRMYGGGNLLESPN